MTTTDDANPNARPNPLNKLALVLGGLFVLACGVFCIGATILDRNFYRSHHTQDAVEVGAIGGRVLGLNVPEILRPSRAIESESFGSMTRAAVWRSSAGSFLVVAQLPQLFDAKATTDVRTELMQMPAVIQSQELYQYHFGGTATTTEKVTIHGVDVEFSIAEVAVGAMGVPGLAGPLSVTATYPTKDGQTGLFLLNVANAELTKEQVVELIRTISGTSE